MSTAVCFDLSSLAHRFTCPHIQEHHDDENQHHHHLDEDPTCKVCKNLAMLAKEAAQKVRPDTLVGRIEELRQVRVVWAHPEEDFSHPRISGILLVGYCIPQQIGLQCAFGVHLETSRLRMPSMVKGYCTC